MMEINATKATALVLGHRARAVARRGFTPRGADDTCRPLATANFRTI